MDLRGLLTQARRVLIAGHHNADPDAVCSMVAFRRLLHEVNAAAAAQMVCDDVSRVAAQVLSLFAPDAEILDSPEGEYDLVVLLDTSSRLQLGGQAQLCLDDPSRVLIVDHHQEPEDVHRLAEHRVIISERSSTCEVLVSLFHELGVEITPDTANLLLTGMIFDTRRFYYADRQTLGTALELVDLGADYYACVSSLVTQPDRSERIARLKAASRLKIHDIEGWIVVTSRVGAFEASACRALLDLGADVAVVGGAPSKGTVRLSSRSTARFYRETGVNLSTDVMVPLGTVIGGTGGGHPNAAGANGTKNRDEALRRAVRLIREAIRRHAQQDTGRGE